MASPSSKVVIAYDDGCGPCSQFKAVVEFLDASKRITFVSLEAADESDLLEGLALGSRYASFHLIRPASTSPGADVRSGSEAILPLMRLLSPWGRGLSRMVETVPGGMPLVSFAYATLSRLHRGCSIQSG